MSAPPSRLSACAAPAWPSSWDQVTAAFLHQQDANLLHGGNFRQVCSLLPLLPQPALVTSSCMGAATAIASTFRHLYQSTTADRRICVKCMRLSTQGRPQGPTAGAIILPFLSWLLHNTRVSSTAYTTTDPAARPAVDSELVAVPCLGQRARTCPRSCTCRASPSLFSVGMLAARRCYRLGGSLISCV